jgi:hypothetical protein
MIEEIKKVKITKGRTLEVELVEHLPDQTDREVIMKCDQLVHNDICKAFDKLKLHLAKICDLYEGQSFTPEDFNSENDLKNFKITSFSLGGSEDQEGVTISGQKELAGSKILNLNTPFTKYADELNPYEYSSELAADIQACVYEAEQYLWHDKYAVKQQELPFEENDQGDGSGDGMEGMIITMSKPKKSRKKGKEIVSEEQHEPEVAEAI